MIYYCVVEIKMNNVLDMLEMVTLVKFWNRLDRLGSGFLGSAIENWWEIDLEAGIKTLRA
jgi:hypothetical protein